MKKMQYGHGTALPESPITLSQNLPPHIHHWKIGDRSLVMTGECECGATRTFEPFKDQVFKIRDKGWKGG